MKKSYTIKKYNGNVAPIDNIEDVTGVDATTSLTFYGKKYQHYGKGFNENFLHLLEHFRSNVAAIPNNPMMGQMWFNNNTKTMMVYNGNFWDTVVTIVPQQLVWSGGFTQVITGNNASFTGTATATANACNFISPITTNDYTITNLPPNFTATVSIDSLLNQANITLSGSMVKTTQSFNFNIAFKQSAFTNVYTIADLLNNPKALALNFASVTNNLPVGDVIITGIPNIDETLTTSNNLTDADGIGSIYYQWMKNGVDITNATSSNYTILATDAGAAITVKAYYTDNLGFYNSKTSSAISIIAPVIPSVALSIVTPFLEKTTNVGEFEGKIRILTTDCTINSIYDFTTQIAAQFNNFTSTGNGAANIDPVVIVKDNDSTSTELLLTITGTSDVHATNISGNLLIDPVLISAPIPSAQLILPVTVSMRPEDADILWNNTNNLQEDSTLNDGTMVGELVVTLPTNFTFVNTPTITMTPIAGLTPVLTLNVAKTVGTITLSGTATVHDTDFTNITFTLLDTDITTTTLGRINPTTLTNSIDITMTAPVYNITWDDTSPFIEDATLNDGTINGSLKATLPTGFTFSNTNVTMSPSIIGITVASVLNVDNNEMTITLTGQATSHETTYSDVTFTLNGADTASTIPGSLSISTLSHMINITMYPAPTTTTTTAAITTTTTTTAAPVTLSTFSSIKFGVTWGGTVDLDTVIAAYDASDVCTAMNTITNPTVITGVTYGGDITTGGIEEYYNIDLTQLTCTKLVLGILEYTDNSFVSMTSLSTRIVDNSNSTNIAQFNLTTITKDVSNTPNTTCIVGVFTKVGSNWTFASYQKLQNSHSGKHAIIVGDTFALLGL
jgi:stress response protein SCP2